MQEVSALSIFLIVFLTCLGFAAGIVIWLQKNKIHDLNNEVQAHKNTEVMTKIITDGFKELKKEIRKQKEG